MRTHTARRAAAVSALILVWLIGGTISSRIGVATAQEITAAAAAQYNAAAELISAGSFTEALVTLNKVVALEPEFPRGYFDRGFVKEQMTDFAGAAADYGKACEFEPDNVDACFGQGKAYYLAEDYEPALAILSTLTETSTQAKIWIQLARTQKKVGMMADATATAARATELEPENADAWLELGTIEYDRQRRSKEYDVAIQAYQKGLELAPDHTNAFAAHFKLGKMQYRTKLYAESEASFLQALEIRPDYASAYIDLGNARNKADNPAGAIEAYQQAIELRAPRPYGMAHYSLARAYWSQDNPDDAIAAYEESIKDPNFKHADKAREAITQIEDYLRKKKKQGGY